MKKLLKAFKKFKKDCSTIEFGSYVINVKLNVVCPYTEEEREAGLKEMERNLNLLKADAVLIPEMKYLANIMEGFLIAVEHRKPTIYLSTDIGKLRFCKTFLAYTNTEYTEATLAIIDHFQDQMVDTHKINRDDVFYFAEVDNDI